MFVGGWWWEATGHEVAAAGVLKAKGLDVNAGSWDSATEANASRCSVTGDATRGILKGFVRVKAGRPKDDAGMLGRLGDVMWNEQGITFGLILKANITSQKGITL